MNPALNTPTFMGGSADQASHYVRRMEARPVGRNFDNLHLLETGYFDVMPFALTQADVDAYNRGAIPDAMGDNGDPSVPAAFFSPRSIERAMALPASHVLRLYPGLSSEKGRA